MPASWVSRGLLKEFESRTDVSLPISEATADRPPLRFLTGNILTLNIPMMKACLLSVLFWAGTMTGTACIQDSFSSRSHLRFNGNAGSRLADAAAGKFAEGPSKNVVRKHLQGLLANPQPENPYWWVNVSGAHLRLGDAATAAQKLETVVEKFRGEYGIRSNLGTAYHLLGRYTEAEREIRAGLQINPESHQGLEYYHLALLQYLSRDRSYQARHLYVDEWTEAFLGIEDSPSLSFSPRGSLL